MKKSTEVLPFPGKSITNIALFFLQQKLKDLLEEENALCDLKRECGHSSTSSSVQSHLKEISTINELQISRLTHLLPVLEEQTNVCPISATQSYYRAMNEDTLEYDPLSTFSQRQTKLVCGYEDALHFAYALNDNKIEEILTQALSDAKRSDTLLKRVGLRIVIKPQSDFMLHRAVMT